MNTCSKELRVIVIAAPTNVCRFDCLISFFCIFNETGGSAWPSGVFLKYTAGDQLGPVNLVSVKPLDAGEYYDLSVNMISPGKTGMYQGQWRMCTPTGQHFGGKVPPLMSRNAPNPKFGYFT